jgi:hypothetical protein
MSDQQLLKQKIEILRQSLDEVVNEVTSDEPPEATLSEIRDLLHMSINMHHTNRLEGDELEDVVCMSTIVLIFILVAFVYFSYFMMEHLFRKHRTIFHKAVVSQ